MVGTSGRLFCCSYWLLMTMLMTSLLLVPLCEGGRLPGAEGLDDPRPGGAAGDGMIAFNIGAWLQLMREKISHLIMRMANSQLKRTVEQEKRGCNGFPCMYTHLGAKAGKQALMKTLLAKLSQCAHDPSCSPGKRRRRSATAQGVMAMLTQQKPTS